MTLRIEPGAAGTGNQYANQCALTTNPRVVTKNISKVSLGGQAFLICRMGQVGP